MFDLDSSGLAGLNPAGTLAAAAHWRGVADHAEAQLLQIAAHFADLHPEPEPSCDDDDHDGVVLPGMEDTKVYGGQGCPEVAEFAPVELGAALGITSHAATRLIGDALALRHRLPRTWARVLAGEVQAWRARKIAAACWTLSQAAAALVDEQVYRVAQSLTSSRLAKIVRAAVLAADPDQADQDAKNEKAERGVWIDQTDADGTKAVFIKAAAGDVIRFDASIDHVADILAQLGDTDTKDLRRAKAIGWLANPQATINLYNHWHQQNQSPPAPTAPNHTPDNHANPPPDPPTDPTPGDHADPTPDPPADRAPGDHAKPTPDAPADRTPGDHADPTPAPPADQAPGDQAPGDHVDHPSDAGHPGHAGHPSHGDEHHGNSAESNPADQETDTADTADCGQRDQADQWLSDQADQGRSTTGRRDPHPAGSAGSAGSAGPAGPGARDVGLPGLGRYTLYVHLTDLTLATGTGLARVGDSTLTQRHPGKDGLGPVLASQLAELLGHPDLIDKITIKPVIDLADRIAVDNYEIPDRIRERVILRYTHCIFPWCNRPATTSIDLDHVQRYDHGDQNSTGPPGQTSTENLAPCCRLHHRIKTHGRWTVRRLPDGAFEWTSQRGRVYRVDHTGTHLITQPGLADACPG